MPILKICKPNYNVSFVAMLNRMKLAIYGSPLSWKHVAGHIHCYNQQRAQNRDFIHWIKLLHAFHRKSFVQFVRRDLELLLTFIITHQWEGDIDTYVKFIMNCLQMEQMVDGNSVRVLDNDIYVCKLVTEKQYTLPGEQLSTTIGILPFVLLVE